MREKSSPASKQILEVGLEWVTCIAGCATLTMQLGFQALLTFFLPLSYELLLFSSFFFLHCLWFFFLHSATLFFT